MSTLSFKVPINPKILLWARERSGIKKEQAAKVASVNIERYQSWEEGKELPTISKLREIANLFKRPLAVFFLHEVPEDIPMPKDFRTFGFRGKHDLSYEARIAIRKASWYQSVARELIDDLSYPIKANALRLNKDEPVSKAISSIRRLDIASQFSWKDNWVALKRWRSYLEEEGIFTFQFAMPSSEMGGFCLQKENYPPAIVINSKDSPNRRIFTLFHEYAHILLSESGMCIPEENELRNKKLIQGESYCNKFAGAFLVPETYFKKSLSETRSTELDDILSDLSLKYKVSKFVILTRMRDINKINDKTYEEMYDILLSKIKNVETGGGDYYKNKLAERGRKLVELTIEAESGEIITKAKALDILDIKLEQYNRMVSTLYEE